MIINNDNSIKYSIIKYRLLRKFYFYIMKNVELHNHACRCSKDYLYSLCWRNVLLTSANEVPYTAETKNYQPYLLLVSFTATGASFYLYKYIHPLTDFHMHFFGRYPR